jgi:hypothetical protein
MDGEAPAVTEYAAYRLWTIAHRTAFATDIIVTSARFTVSGTTPKR